MNIADLETLKFLLEGKQLTALNVLVEENVSKIELQLEELGKKALFAENPQELQKKALTLKGKVEGMRMILNQLTTEHLSALIDIAVKEARK